MIEVTSPENSGSALICQAAGGMSLDEAAKRYVGWMPARGITVESNSKVIYNGLDGRHVKGRLSLAGCGSAIPTELYIISTQESVLSVEVRSAEASSMINQVMSWIEFKNVGNPPRAGNEIASSGRGLFEYLGIGVVFAAVGYAVFNSISTRGKKMGNRSRWVTDREPQAEFGID
jgi:hypothetical protein